MKYILLFEELNKENLRQEVDIIYKDSNLICLIPKTQRASYIYGHKTYWCSKEKGTFDDIIEEKNITFDINDMIIKYDNIKYPHYNIILKNSQLRLGPPGAGFVFDGYTALLPSRPPYKYNVI